MLIIELLVSASLLWVYDKSNLLVLGINPTKPRMKDLAFGFISSGTLCAVSLFVISIITRTLVTLNPDFTWVIFLSSFFWMLKSVLIEELLFRGVILYVGIKKLGIHWACVLSSIAFGIYHWFSYNVFGDVAQMIYVFFVTGVGGILFAYAFALTRSLYLPIGLHLGWNVVNVVVFSQGPLGKQMFVYDGGQPLNTMWSISFFLYQVIVLPLVTYFYITRRKSTAIEAI